MIVARTRVAPVRAVRRVGARRVATTLALLVLVVGACTTTVTRDELATEYYNIGTAYFELGELEKSATYLARALDLSPGLARASYNLARVYVQQGRHGEAAALLETLLEADPDNSLVLETLGYARYEAGDLDEAAAWYDRALEVNPTDIELLQNRATVAERADRADRAAFYLRRATELEPERSELYRRLAEAELAAGERAAAADAYAEYADTAADPDPASLIQYAALLSEAEFYADALSVLGRVGELADVPVELEARASFERARLLLTVAEEPELGLEALRAAVDLGFSDAEDARALVDAATLVAGVEVEAVLREAGLIGEEGPKADEPADEPAESDDPSGTGAAESAAPEAGTRPSDAETDR